MLKTFFHTGDLGDLIAALPTIKAMGGGHLTIGVQIQSQRESLRGARLDSIRPLLDAQDYIASVQWVDERPRHSVDFSTFRDTKVPVNTNLLDWQALHVGVEVTSDPWLDVTPRFVAPTIVARSSRYHNKWFPWNDVLSVHNQAVFVGLPHEHEEFVRETGVRIDFQPTRNLLELAEIISGADLFVGNQSCPFWIATGVGTPLVQEMFRTIPNSFVPRETSQFWVDGCQKEVRYA